MPQFLVAPEDIAGKHFALKGPEAFHVTRVLRRAPGSALDLFDGRGGRYRGVIERIGADGTVEGALESVLELPRPARFVRLRLYLGLLKSSRWDWALEKGTELGVHAFVPVLTPRTVVQLREEAAPAKRARWERVVVAAAKQCGRPDLPQVHAPLHFRDAIVEAAKRGPVFLGWEALAETSPEGGLREGLRALPAGPEALELGLFIGPEGGFSEEEAELAACEGARLFRLGARTLRSETAALAAAAVALSELGEL